MRLGTPLLALALVASPFAAADDAGGGGQPPPPDIELDGVSDTFTGTLQGKEGLRIQTLCTHCNSANIQVGGLAQEFAPVFVDGYPVLGGLATSMVFSIMPPDTIAGAEVRKGPDEAVAPSGAAGGRILLEESRPTELPRFDSTVEGGTFDRFRGVARVSGSISPRIHASLVAGHEEADPVDDDDDGINDVGSVDRDFAGGRMTFSLGRGHTFDVGASWIDEENLEGRGAFDRFAYIDPVDPEVTWTREDAVFEREEYRAGWVWKLDRGDRLEVRGLGATRDQKLRSQLEDPTDVFSDVLYDRFTIREDNLWGTVRYVRGLGLSARLSMGIQAKEQEVSATTIEGSDILLQLQFPGLGIEAIPQPGVDSVRSWSGYADLDWTPSPRWSFGLGARYDDATWESETFTTLTSTWTTEKRSRDRTSPRATVRFSPSDAWTLKLVAGGTFRTPTPILSEICCGQRYQRSVDTSAETGSTYGLEARFQPSADLRVSAYVARSDFEDYILRSVGWSQDYIQTYVLANVPETRAEAADLAVRWSPHRMLALDGSVGWLSHHNRGDSTVTVLVAPPSQSAASPQPVFIDRIPYQPVRTGSLSATLSWGRGISLTGQASYTGSMKIQQFEDPLSAPFQNTLAPSLRSTPGFWIANLSFEAPIPGPFTVVGGVNNVTDRVQNDLDDPSTDYNWGPLAGRTWRLGLKYFLDRRGAGS